jgi:hypothetical protein
LELLFGEKHNKNVVGYDHAGCSFIGKLRVELKAEFGEEFYGFA